MTNQDSAGWENFTDVIASLQEWNWNQATFLPKDGIK